MRFSGDLVLRTHMRMNGSWHIYKRRGVDDSHGRTSRGSVRAGHARGDCHARTSRPSASTCRSRSSSIRPRAASAGPPADRSRSARRVVRSQEAVRRFRPRSTLSIADALINQRIVAGRGMSSSRKLLFLCGSIRLYASRTSATRNCWRCWPPDRSTSAPTCTTPAER